MLKKKIFLTRSLRWKLLEIYFQNILSYCMNTQIITCCYFIQTELQNYLDADGVSKHYTTHYLLREAGSHIKKNRASERGRYYNMGRPLENKFYKPVPRLDLRISITILDVRLKYCNRSVANAYKRVYAFVPVCGNHVKFGPRTMILEHSFLTFG